MSGYTKLFSSITDSTIWAAPDTTRIVWITMLAMADQYGYVGASVPGLAARARVSIDACVAALKSFSEPDEWSRTTLYEGRRIALSDGGWVLINHAKYRAAVDTEVRREKSRVAMAELRKKRSTNLLTEVIEVNKKSQELAQAEAEAEAKPLTTNTTGAQKRTPFVKPSIEEVEAYCQERRNDVSVASWFDHYDTNGWKVGRNSMKDWRASIRTWERNERGNGNGKTQQHSKPSLAERATNARKEYERSIGLGDTVRAIDGEFVGTYEPPVRT